jgi:Tol biopolymer transport system component
VLAATSLLAATAALSLSGPAAGAETLCTVSEITDTGSGGAQDPSVDAQGDTVVFASTQNLVGTNLDGSTEIYLYDATTGEFEQITNTLGSNSFNPTISDDGNRIAFSSAANILSANADGNSEIFRYDRDTDTFTQLTTSTGGSTENTAATISGDGSRVAFVSDLNLLGTNTELNPEVFWSTAAGTLTQVTSTASGAAFSGLGFNDSGTRLMFTGPTNPTGGNADLSFEVFNHVVGGATTQLTTTTGASLSPSAALSGDGLQVAFEFDRDLTGGNADASQEIFRTTDGTDITQLTAEADGSFEPTIDQDGSRVAFRSAADHTGGNGDGNGEIFLHDTTDGFIQLTDSAGGGAAPSEAPALSDDGSRIAFISNRSLDGPNDGGNSDLFLASCSSPDQTFTDVPPSSTFFDEISWMASAGISTGFQPGPTYKPSQAVSRAAMSAFMYRLAGLPPFEDPPTATFSDVATTSQFFTEIEWMNDEGITNGFPGGLYKPSQAVSRAAMSAFMYRLAGEPVFPDPPTATFTDVATTSQFFTEIEWMADEEITTGFQPGPIYKPSASVTRAAMSAFMFRLADGPGVDLID